MSIAPNAAQRQAVSEWLTQLQGQQGIGREIDWIALAHNIAEAVVNAPSEADGEVRSLSEHVQSLDAKCVELERDAARYRWLLDNAFNIPIMHTNIASLMDVEKAIDAAMSAQSDKEESK